MRIFSLIVLLAALMTGCMFQSEPYTEITYYDLATIRLDMPPDLPIIVESFQSSEAGRAQMTYLASNNQVKVDSYNRWVQQPEYLITRYLQTAVSGNSPAIREFKEFRKTMTDGIRLSGTIFAMRIDLKRQEAILGINYMIRCVRNNEKITELTNSGVFTVKYNKETPVEFAIAMSEAAEKMATQIQREIFSLYNQKWNNTDVKTTTPTPVAD